MNANNLEARWLHSFHIHVNPFQIVSQNKGISGQLAIEDLEVGDWRDTVQIPAGGNVTLRMKNRDFTGVFPFHCHVTAHQGIGMIQMVEVVDDLAHCTGRTSEETTE